MYIAIALTAVSANAQVGINTDNPRPNAVLEIKSKEGEIQGVKFPESNESNITIEDVVAVKPDSMVGVNNDGLMFYDTISSCFRYYNLSDARWWNLCGTPPPAVFELADCSNAQAIGTYLIDEPLTVNNYLRIPVNVSQPGTYSIEAAVKDAGNNSETYYFSTKGIFPKAGYFDVIVPGAGFPATSGNHTANVTMNGVLQTCDIPITVLPRDPDYIILSVEQMDPKWNILTPLDDGTKKVMVKLLVYNPGTWGLTTSEVNGYSFAATGETANAQGYNPAGSFPQTVTVLVPVAAGQANVYGTGSDHFLMSTTTSKTASNYEFNIQLSKGGFKLNRVQCSDPNLIIHLSLVSALFDTDTVRNGEEFVSDAYIKIPIEVTAPGQYIVYANFAGVQFATCTDNGTSYTASQVTLLSTTNTLTLYPVGAKDASNANRKTNTTVYDTPIELMFSAGDADGPDGIAGNADDWSSESGYYTEDLFCRPAIVVKPSVARFADITLAQQAPTSGINAHANGMRYLYNTAIAGNYTTASMNAATQGVYTIDAAGNTPVSGINLTTSYSIPGDYNFRVKFGEGADTIVYVAKGELPPLPGGHTLGAATITLAPFKIDEDGDFVDAGGNKTTDPAQYVWNTRTGNPLPITVTPGKYTDVIYYYTSADDPSSGIMTGTIEVPLWFGYRAMKIVSLGSADFSLNNPNSVGYSLLGSDVNFGYNGTVPVGGVTLTRITSATDVDTEAELNTAIRDADIVLIQYVNGFGNPGNNRAKVLAEFLQRGGALMYSCETPGSYIEGIMNTIYGVSNLTAAYEGGRYKFGILQTPGTADYENNPILNGPFSQGVDITAVGNDNGTGSYITSPAALAAAAPNGVVMATRSNGGVFMFFDPTKGLLYCGDGGWLASNTWDNTSTVTYPLVTTSDYKPRAKNFSGTGGHPTTSAGNVYNSYLFCNYLAWAIEYAAHNRDHSQD
jgi:hypothetical protein